MTTTLAPPPTDAITAAVDVLRTAADDLDGLAPEALRARFDVFRELEGLATAGQAAALRGLSRAGQVRADGAASTTTWVQAATGRSTREAGQLARLAGALDHLPATAAALADGTITAEAADAVVRAASDGRLGDAGDVDTALARAARSLPPEKLRAEIRRRTQAVDGAALLRDERRQHAQRRLTIADRPDGMVAITGQVTTEVGNRLRTVLDAYDLPDPRDTPAELRRDHGQRLADALDGAARHLAEHGRVDATGGRVPQVVVHVDLPTVQADLGTEDAPPSLDDAAWAALPTGRLDWGGELSPQAVRRILCGAGVTRIVTAGGSLALDAGRSTRQWTFAQRRAITARDRGCRGPTCDRPPGWTQIHHLRWWRNGGPTDLANGIALCHHCHHLVHDDGWQVRLDHDTGDAHWTAPDGSSLLAPARARGSTCPTTGR